MVVYISVTCSYQGIAPGMIIKKMFLHAAREGVFNRDPLRGKWEFMFFPLIRAYLENIQKLPENLKGCFLTC